MTTQVIEPRPPVFTHDLESPGQESLVAQGKALRRTQTQFTTAIAVIKPRDRKEVIRACEEEASIAGDEFYYSWTVKGQKGSQLVEGLSVQGALSGARNWGNCAIPVEIEDKEGSYDFTATFLDLETGFNLQRIFRQRKEQNIGMKDKARAEDIVFQIGQSKAIRNVILSALPSWLTSKMLAKAKENIMEKINNMGLAVARDKTVAFFVKYGVAQDNIEHKVGKKASAWTVEDLALLQGAMNALLAGQESAESLFPAPNEEVARKTEAKAEALTWKLQEAKAPTVKSPPAPEGLYQEPGTIESAKRDIAAGLVVQQKDEQKFYQACVYEFCRKDPSKLLGNWTVADYQQAYRLMNALSKGEIKMVIMGGQPMFVPAGA